MWCTLHTGIMLDDFHYRLYSSDGKTLAAAPKSQNSLPEDITSFVTVIVLSTTQKLLRFSNPFQKMCQLFLPVHQLC